ncbi:MAG: ATP-binding protein [Candidatus Binatia bacterium]
MAAKKHTRRSIGSIILPLLQSSFDPLADRKRNLIGIQAFVVIATAYLLLFKNGWVVQDPLVFLMLLAPLGSIFVFQRLPQSVFEHKLFAHILVIVDTVFLSAAIAFNRESPWDLFLVFFFGIFIAAIGENLTQIVVGCLVLSIVSIVVVPLSSGEPFQIDADTLFRIPLIFGASILYGYLVTQLKAERKRIVQLRQEQQHRLQLKDEFLSHVSHELRSPLAASHQFVTILLDGLAGELNDEQREYLDIVLKNITQLRTMIGDLLEVTRADTGKLAIDLRCTSLVESITETIGALLTTAAAKGVELSADVPGDLPPVHVDPPRIRQILVNLIDNGVKFTPAKGKITVRARVFDQDRKFICVAVADTGCGISPEGTQRIFDRLYQEPNNNEASRKGLGLGLHICKELVSRHGGRIWVESRLGQGSSFYFTLPIFSLEKLLYPVITEDNRLKETISLITVELSPVDGGTPTKLTETMRQEAWQGLHGCITPGKELLLPRMTNAAGSELFYVVECGDRNSSVMAVQKIREQLSQSGDVQKGSIGVTVTSAAMDPQLGQNGASLEQQVEGVSTRVLDVINAAVSQRAKNVKRDLFGVMSQKVRQPLSVVMGYAGILRDKLLGELTPEQEDALSKVMHQTDDLLTIFNNVLEAQRIESGKVKLDSHEVPVTSFLDELRSTYEVPRTKALTLKWNYPPDLPTMLTDGSKLRVILQNLINNAIKFTEKGTVTVTAWYSDKTENIELKVADTGIGISGVAIPVIFDRLQQLQPSEVDALGGMGLGLYIVRTFTELLGGKVDVQSDPGKGSVFSVTLPVRRSEPAVSSIENPNQLQT